MRIAPVSRGDFLIMWEMIVYRSRYRYPRHSEPVRTLAWESVSPAAQRAARCSASQDADYTPRVLPCASRLGATTSLRTGFAMTVNNNNWLQPSSCCAKRSLLSAQNHPRVTGGDHISPLSLEKIKILWFFLLFFTYILCFDSIRKQIML